MRKSYLFVLALLATGCQNAQELKTQQYFVEGLQLYINNCANCHQLDGTGMASLYPPLKGSAVLKNKELLACIIRNGMKDTILVNGKNFSRPMPPNPKLTDLEIAEIITYVSVKWQKDSIFTNTEFVNTSLQNCK